MTYFIRIGLVLIALLALPTLAIAKNWNVDYGHSRLSFTGLQNETPFTESFRTFTAQIDLDPAKPEGGKITATIDIASATAGSDERDSYLPQTDWFDTSAFPQAKFESMAIHKTDATHFTAEGTLAIKDIARPVVLTFTLVPEQDHWHAKGHLALRRGDYHVGEGEWASEAYVKQAVDVSFDIIATPEG